MLIVGSVVIRVREMDREIRFWTQALDYAVREPAEPDFAVLCSRDRRGPNISLDRARVKPTLPPRIHLDLYAEDQEAEVARLTGLGAESIDWPGRPADADYVIMQDPEGNRFCVIDSADWDGWSRIRASSGTAASNGIRGTAASN